jgi:hypothetical protein
MILAIVFGVLRTPNTIGTHILLIKEGKKELGNRCRE